MTDLEISVLLKAAKQEGLDPAKLSVRNPWEMQGSVTETMQQSLIAVDPSLAQRWQKEAGIGLSLAATAVEKGLAPLTNETLAEFQ